MGHSHSHHVAEPPADWNAPELKTWLKLASKTQTNYYLAYHGAQFDEYKPNEYDLISLKICYAIFGPPKIVNDNTREIKDILYTYSLEERNKAKELKDKIVSVHRRSTLSGSNLCMSTIFVVCKEGANEYHTPVFRVRVGRRTPVDESNYVDITGRVYHSWDNWKSSNELPPMKYCYPKSGYYTAQDGLYKYNPKQTPVLEHAESPASSAVHQALQKADLGLGILGFIAAAVEIASFFIPVAGPILVVAEAAAISAALYGSGRYLQMQIEWRDVLMFLSFLFSEPLSAWSTGRSTRRLF